MSISVPGNSCRTSCYPVITGGCTTRLPGESVYYSGLPISGPTINTGDVFNTVVNKIITYINNSIAFPASIIPITSDDFAVDGITCNISAMNGVDFEIFLNDIPRFIYNEVGNQEWDYVTGGGFKVLIPGFDANSFDYHLYLFPKA